jgi:serine/threonine-protein kinase
VSVPNLVGLAAGDAQRLVEEYGLSLEVAAERESEQNLPGTVLDQQPRPGARVRSGTTIRVSLASGREFTLPDVIGYHIDLIQPNLERQGLIVVQEEARSEEPRGQIVEQTPPPQTVVRAGNAVTLTVSGGMEQPISLHVNLSNRVMLEEALLPRQGFQPGETIPVTLRWRALQSLDRSYTVFVHLLTPNLQTLITQDDSVPVNGLNPTDLWQPGEIVVDPHQLALPEDLPSGTYQIRVGLYTQEGRLAVTDSGETRVQENSILVAPVQVAP